MLELEIAKAKKAKAEALRVKTGPKRRIGVSLRDELRSCFSRGQVELALNVVRKRGVREVVSFFWLLTEPCGKTNLKKLERC